MYTKSILIWFHWKGKSAGRPIHCPVYTHKPFLIYSDWRNPLVKYTPTNIIPYIYNTVPTSTDSVHIELIYLYSSAWKRAKVSIDNKTNSFPLFFLVVTIGFTTFPEKLINYIYYFNSLINKVLNTLSVTKNNYYLTIKTHGVEVLAQQ